VVWSNGMDWGGWDEKTHDIRGRDVAAFLWVGGHVVVAVLC